MGSYSYVHTVDEKNSHPIFHFFYIFVEMKYHMNIMFIKNLIINQREDMKIIPNIGGVIVGIILLIVVYFFFGFIGAVIFAILALIIGILFASIFRKKN